MAKRFTATEKWDDPWFCGLKPIDRSFWQYILDKCDHAGIWQVNWPLVKFYHGQDFEYNADAFDSRIVKLSSHKWFIPKFVSFQYGELNPENKAHASVVAILKKEGAWKVLGRSLEGPKDKDKDKDKELDKDKAKAFTVPTIEEVRAYCQERRNRVSPERWLAFYQSNGWMVGKNKMKDWKAAIHTWEHSDGFVQPESKPQPQRIKMCPDCGQKPPIPNSLYCMPCSKERYGEMT